jgi:Raf kinase inhibitor-like YbhB/YbcL family protein
MRPTHPSHATFTFRIEWRAARCSWRFAIALCGILLSPILFAPVASCGSPEASPAPGRAAAASGFRIESAAFTQGATIPARYTCQGENISPPLAWTEPPAGTRSLALIVEDPDAPAGTWTHWVVYNLPAQNRAMGPNMPKQDTLPNGGLQGITSFGRAGYGGPCPPPGRAHRYFFRLYALDLVLNLKPGAAKQDVLAATKGHILAEAQLMGRFKR